MWPDVIPATTLMLVWLGGITWGFYRQGTSRKTGRFLLASAGIWGGGLVALIVRLVPLLILPVGAGYDIESYKLVGEALTQGKDVYTSAAQGRHPYLPLFMYWIGIAFQLAKMSPIPFVIWIKLPALVADLAVTFLLYGAARERTQSETEAHTIALLYALNPISILVTAYHGQFDALPVLFLLLAWLWWRKRLARSGLALGFAILIKSWPLVFLPVVLLRLSSWRKRLWFAGISLAIPALFTGVYVFVFQSDPVPMLRRAFTHAGNAGFWGWSAILFVAQKIWTGLEPLYQFLVGEAPYNGLFSFPRWLLVGTGLLALWITRKQRALPALVMVILMEFALTAGIGIQWLLWLVPFALLDGEWRWVRWYTLAGTLFILGQLYGLHLYPWLPTLWPTDKALIVMRVLSLPAWLVVGAWCWQRWRVGDGANKFG